MDRDVASTSARAGPVAALAWHGVDLGEGRPGGDRGVASSSVMGRSGGGRGMAESDGRGVALRRARRAQARWRPWRGGEGTATGGLRVAARPGLDDGLFS